MSSPRIKAPEFPDSTEWLNTDEPVRLENYRGKVILLDFWSYCHTNCLQSQADLQYLEKKYSDGLVVVGIHSPKFAHERETASINKAITRQRVQHPVINDAKYDLWKRFRIKSWPSLIVIDTDGYILGVLSGPGRRQQIDGLIHKQLTYADLKNTRDRTPFTLTEHPDSLQTLNYPGRVLAEDDRLYISDSGHHRVLECTQEGKILRCFGTKRKGFLDGALEDASFNNPQGLAKLGDYLYVADSGNHAIRRIQLQNGEVQTVIGDGRQGFVTNQDYADPSIAQLNYPWGLHVHDGSLYISMAGSHQLWRWNLSMNQLSPFTGNGQEGMHDGVANTTMFAQPSGISSADDKLFVADASSSSIRSISMPDVGVSTLVGQGLHDYGNQDGPARMAKLQHPMDLAYDRKRDLIWICDTYNNKLKYFRMAARDVKSLDLVGLDEPEGMSLDGDFLWVVNTNQHKITRLDLVNGNADVIDIK